MFRALFVLVSVAIGLPAAAALPDGVELLHYERLLPVEAGTDGAEAPHRDLNFHAFGRMFALELVPHALGGAPAQRGLALHRGRLAGVADSWVRLAEQDGRLSGMFWDGRELYVIESAGELLADAAALELTAATPLIFRLADLRVPAGLFACAVDHDSRNGAAAYRALLGELDAAAAQGATQRIDIGMAGDHELFVSFGSNRATAESAIQSRMNTVDGIFSSQAGIEIMVAEVNVFDTPADPFTPTLDAGELLPEVADYKGDTVGRRALGLAHLYTGRNFSDQTVGIAFRGTLCDARFSVGITERQGSAFIDALITAHEIGHNFGAIHDGDFTNDPDVGAIDCSGTPNNVFLMAPQINGSSQFSQCSLDTMAKFIARATCLRPVGPPDGTVLVPTATVAAGLEIPLELPLTVRNLGAEQLENVTVRVRPEPELRLLSAMPASCSIVLNEAVCTLGNIPPRSDLAVNVRLQGDSLGTFTVEAVLSATNDAEPGNDTSSFEVRVDPSVNLAVAIAGPASAMVGTPVDYALIVTNLLPGVDATGVVLAIGLPLGFRANTATPSQGSCTLQSASVSCALGTLTDEAGVDLQMTTDGPSTHRLSATVSANQLDRDTSDNAMQLLVTATGNGTGGAGGGSGGGTPGVIPLAFLCGLLLARRRR